MFLSYFSEFIHLNECVLLKHFVQHFMILCFRKTLVKSYTTSLQIGKSYYDKTKFMLYDFTNYSDVSDDMKICKEEIFGPVQVIQRFTTRDEVIDRANKEAHTWNKFIIIFLSLCSKWTLYLIFFYFFV